MGSREPADHDVAQKTNKSKARSTQAGDSPDLNLIEEEVACSSKTNGDMSIISNSACSRSHENSSFGGRKSPLKFESWTAGTGSRRRERRFLAPSFSPGLSLSDAVLEDNVRIESVRRFMASLTCMLMPEISTEAEILATDIENSLFMIHNDTSENYVSDVERFTCNDRSTVIARESILKGSLSPQEFTRMREDEIDAFARNVEPGPQQGVPHSFSVFVWDMPYLPVIKHIKKCGQIRTITIQSDIAVDLISVEYLDVESGMTFIRRSEDLIEIGVDFYWSVFRGKTTLHLFSLDD